MDSSIDAPSETDRLLALADCEHRFDITLADLLPRQLKAMNERFKNRIEQIKLLQHRAETSHVTEIRRLSDIVPLLFAHTTYKSYPEGWLMEKKWDRLGR